MSLSAAFHDVRFPTDIAFGAERSLSHPTDIVTLGSGHEQRNQRWRDSRRRYDVGFGVKTLQQLHAVAAFFEARKGAQHSFRFRDFLDWKSCPPGDDISPTDQVLGIGDGQQSRFQIAKTYGEAPFATRKAVNLVEQSSLLVAVDGVATTTFQLDPLSGMIEFPRWEAPPAGVEITVGFHFDVPVRFANEDFTISLAAFNGGEVPNVSLLEVRL